MAAPSGLERLSAALDQNSTRWDLVSRTKFDAFERELNNTLAANDMLELVKRGAPTMDIIITANPNASELQCQQLLLKATQLYDKADVAAHKMIERMLSWKQAPGRLAEISAIEKSIGRPSGHELYKFVYKCRDKSSYEDQKAIKKEYIAITIPYGASHEHVRTKLNDKYSTWSLIKGNEQDDLAPLYSDCLELFATNT